MVKWLSSTHSRDKGCLLTRSFWLTLVALPAVVIFQELQEVHLGIHVIVQESAILQQHRRASGNKTDGTVTPQNEGPDQQHQILDLVNTSHVNSNNYNNHYSLQQTYSLNLAQPNSTEQVVSSAAPAIDVQQSEHLNDTQQVIEITETSEVNGSQATLNLSEQKHGAASDGTTTNETTGVAPLLDVPHPIPQQRLNATQILNLVAANSLNSSQVPLIFPKPPVDSYDVSSIYSMKAWLKLRSLFLTKGKDNLVMCVQGASSSAGSPDVQLEDRYHHLFANNAIRDVTFVDRAHGSRNGMHSVHLMHSFLPMQTDIVLWEFAITDATYNQFDNNQNIKMTEARNQLILWLDQLARVAKRRQKEPPLVILVYLWNAYQFNDYISPPNLAYEASKGVAEQYDFVVGHVNAGKYFASMWESNVTRNYFLSDPVHPNSLAHHVVSYLLNDLLLDTNRPERPRTNQTTTTSPATFQWACGDDTPEKRVLRGLIENSHVIASFTQEEPKNQDLLPGMMMPMVGGDLKIEDLGKSSALRIDRKYSAVLPCCGESIMSFDNVTSHGVMEGLQLVLHRNSTGLTLFLDDRNVTDKLIDCRNRTQWVCLFSDVTNTLLHWVVLETPRNVSSITMCNHLPTCNATGNDHLSLQSLAVYGQE